MNLHAAIVFVFSLVPTKDSYDFSLFIPNCKTFKKFWKVKASQV